MPHPVLTAFRCFQCGMFDQLSSVALTVPSLWMFRLALTWSSDPRLEGDYVPSGPLSSGPNIFVPLDFLWTAACLAFERLPNLQVASFADDCYGMDSWWYRPSLSALEFSEIGPELQGVLSASYAEHIYTSMVKLQREYCVLCCTTPCSCMFNWDG